MAQIRINTPPSGTLQTIFSRGLFKALAVILISLLPMGAWGQEEWTEVSTAEELRTIFANGGNAKIADDVTNNEITSSTTFTVSATTDVVLDLNGKTIRKTGTGTAIIIETGATLYICDNSANHDGKITGGNNSQTASASNPGNINCGGGIRNNGTFYFQSGIITGNSAGDGAGVFNNGTMEMSGGEISGNTCNYSGYGIFNNGGGSLTITGGKVINNTGGYNLSSSPYGGGIFNRGASLTLSGNPVIKDNTGSGGQFNIYLYNGNSIIIGTGGLTGNNGDIGIMMQTPGVFTSGLNSTTDYQIFTSDHGDYEPCFGGTDNKEATLLRNWLSLKNRMEVGGTIVLNKNYTAINTDTYLEVPSGKEVTLDLNGKTINRNLTSSTTDGCVIKNLNSLTITGTGTITGGKVSGSGGAIINSGTLNIQGGTFNGNSATANGGAIFNTGTTTITGGSLTGNTAAQGGAIYNSGTLTISAGNISSNTASTNGGGIYHFDGTLNISGAPSISGNQKSSAANNIYLASGKKITVNGNLSNTTPIGVTLADGVGEFTTGLNSHVGDYEKFESDDNRFQSADATGEAKLWTFWAKLNAMLDAGGTINLDRTYTPIAGYDNTYLSVNSNITLNLNTYTINRSLATAIDDGFVIKVESGYTLTITGTGTIRGGNNTGNGGGIYIDGGTLVLSGGSITSNIAATGGGIYNGGTLQMSGNPMVKSNTGGNIYLPDDHTTITLTGTLNGTDGNIGITMQSPGTFTSGLNTYGTIAKFFSDNATYEVALSANEATLMTPWAVLKAAFAAGGEITLTKNYTAPADDHLEVVDGKTVTLDLKGRTIDRGLSGSAAVDNGYVIKVNTGSTLTIKDTGSNGIIKGGNNTGNGGGIINEGTLNIQGGTITSNSAANGGAIYNSGTLTVSGGTIQSNTATTNGGAIYHNGTAFSLQGSPTITSNTVSSTANNVYLAASKQITISGVLTYADNKAIGIACEDDHLVFTTGLSGKGNASKFTSNQTEKGIGLNSAGEAIFGTSFPITRNHNDNSVYLYIKGDWYNPMSAVEGEYVRVRLGAYYSEYVPVSLDYTDGTLSTYPEYSTEYTFTMPAHAVTVTGLGKPGGYCGVSTVKNIKYYLDGTTLRFVAKDASDYQMENYAQTTVPWRNYDYSTVDIPSNITNIGNYAFYGSNLATIDIPSTVTSIGTFAFGNCQNLTTLTVADANTNYQAVNNVLYGESEGNPTNLICYPAGLIGGSYELPSTVTSITSGAFAYESHLTAITVAGGTAFMATDGVLYGQNGSGTPTSLVYYPSAKADETYRMPTTVTAINDYAFFHQQHLRKVVLLHESVPTKGSYMFDGTTYTFPIMVKKNMKANYIAGGNWGTTYQNRIYELDIAQASIDLSQTTFNYDGNSHTPTVTVTRAGFTLVEGIDYSLRFDNDDNPSNSPDLTNVNPITVYITGIGDYDGTSDTEVYNINRSFTINVTGNYATYYATENLEKPTNIKIYTISTGNVDFANQKVTLTEINYIPAGVPVLLYHSYNSTLNGTYSLSKKTTGLGSITSDERFRGVAVNTSYATLKPEGVVDIYVMKSNHFYKVDGTLPGELKANRCYIARLSGDAAPSRLNIGEDDGTTEIEEVRGKMEDGRDVYYDLQGRRLIGKPTKKGIYIMNGKKVVIK